MKDVSAAPCILRRPTNNAARWQPGERLEHLFAAALARHPDAIAVETPSGTVTFAALDDQAARLATRLEAAGYGPGDVVALLFGRCAEAYVAMLAVLRIGAAYVPLDPVFPPDRVRYIAADAGVAAVMTMSEHLALAQAAELPAIALDLPVVIEPARQGRPRAPDDLAYVIYTSGSTGRPKGVRIEHPSIVNFVRVAAETYGYRPGDRVYQGLTLAFDFSVEEIWVPLIAGAALVPSCAKGSLVGADLHAFLASQRITALCCVPTLLATLDEPLPDLRLLIVSGEACPEEIVRRWHGEGRTILNAYGPTEITVTATISHLSATGPVTLGLPLATYTVVILDPDAPHCLAMGESGEIGIAGIGLSSGYVGRDDLTAKAFVADFLDLPDNPSRRIYRTGDLGRVNAEGLLEYLGRIDTQVKIRGYRVELSEIESLILQQPGIAQAVVAPFESEPGLVELVAYYTATDHVPPEVLADALEKALPSYMVPAFYERLDAIAMLPSDKADRKALPPPSGQRLIRRSAAFVAPVTATESRLAAMLADILRIERISVMDDFFADLGANSLILARFSTRVRRAFDAPWLSMREIYGAPTLHALAALIDATREVGDDTAPAAPAHIASGAAYWATGGFQFLATFTGIWAAVSLAQIGLAWVAEAVGPIRLYARAAVLSIFAFLALLALPVIAKWVLIGRWRPASFPIWSLSYARFWTVSTLIRFSPLAQVPGTPVYNAFLRALGANVAWDAMVLCPPPVCTDLVSIGKGAVVGRDVMLPGYRAEGGRIQTGPTAIGARAFVGDGSVFDINTVMEDDTELGHVSALMEGQTIPAGESHGGVPAIPCRTRFRTLPPGTVPLSRRLGFTVLQLGWWLMAGGPAAVLLLLLGMGAYATAAPNSDLFGQSLATLPALLVYATLLFFAVMALDLARVLVLPRIAWRFLQEGRIYRLYGLRHYMLRTITANSNSRFFNLLFGDSSAIVHYLRAVGYRFPDLKQTGSNFGVQQRHDVPFLCEFGSGTMVSDDLSMANADFSNAAFRLGTIRFGRDNFLGNDIIYPAQAATGDNVLLGTRVMIPVEGAAPRDTGLLGAPAFAIPRSVSRDRRFDSYKTPEVLAARLRLKNRSNLSTALLFIAARLALLAAVITASHLVWHGLDMTGPFWISVQIVALDLLVIALAILFERASYGFGHHSPQFCSIYDAAFWAHERFWKLSAGEVLTVLNGTPFKALALRALGVRVGRNLYDDGCAIVERTLTAIGNDCTLNMMTTVQAHSLEDGTFKSDRIEIGDGVTLGLRAFVHYGTAIGDGVSVGPASFVMKGEAPAPASRWGGNPARPLRASSSRTEGDREVVELILQPEAPMTGKAAMSAL
ncbi:Pls/PosA family non-ribosomal peptide synthetase [Falsirhodobacter xinxiangensis]|uniref:Pls/PosA family non-ribosomal peptide synthetase n=1 Tax=Falsirhodobacter xinxiangensis TaxID=2530049 RepID=UPI0010AA6981|nr:Pls/PosA family non-ribosomal peptide synthetase [Rhodobacter xinxiangensis]